MKRRTDVEIVQVQSLDNCTAVFAEVAMRRREFFKLLFGGAASWPLAARAQANSERRVAALWPFNEEEAEAKTLLAALQQGLREFGWVNVRIESRWVAVISSVLAPTQQSSCSYRQMSFLRTSTRNLLHFRAKPAKYRSYSWVPPIPWAPDTWQVCRIPAATSPALHSTSHRLRESGLAS